MGDVAERRGADSPAGTAWTAELVGECLVEAFRLMPSVPIYSPAPSHLVATRPHAQPAYEVIAATARYLKPRSEARVLLLSWARARATGASISALCREKGWPRSSFERARSVALELVARGLNRDGVALTERCVRQ